MQKFLVFILFITLSFEQSGNFTTINNLTKTNNNTDITNFTKNVNFTEINNCTGAGNFSKKYNETKKKSHFQDCSNNSNCEKDLYCKLNRCVTKFELYNLKELGLEDKNVCDFNKPCPSEKKCLKHRCVNSENELDLPRKKRKTDTSVNLLFAGSIFLNGKAYISGIQSNDSFNYDHFFKHIKNDIKNADLAVVDQETVFQTNKTNFQRRVGNTPTELGDAIANAGFKLVLHGTIYAYSKRSQGIRNTINFWDDNYPDIHVLGISKNSMSSEKDYYIFKKNNIKIGIINFSAFQNLIPKNREYLVNIISKEKIKNLVGKLKNETDFVIVCMNWGEKNYSSPNKQQVKFAKDLAANGVKLIIGNHPSMVHPVSYVKSKGKKALVLWSLGHLVSDSQKQYSYLGALANITISRGKGKGFISNFNLIPIINHKVNNTNYSVYKLSEYSQELVQEAYKEFSMENVTEKCKKIMGPFINFK